MSTRAKEKCPLCLETMDLTDKQLKPCKCGYEICLWCWHHIMEMDQKDECGGRCPGCRSTYNKDRILETSISNQILKELLYADKSNLQKERTNFQKQNSTKNQLRVAEEQIDPNSVRVIQKKLVYIVGMPSEFASDKILRQKDFLGQYGKIENIIIDNVGACQQSPDSGRVYVTFSREEEAVQCIESVNGFILDGRPLKATFGVTRYCHVWLSNKVCQKPNCTYVHQKAQAEDICTKDDVAAVCARLQHLLGMDMKGPQQRSGSTLPSPGVCNSRTTICNADSKNKICINDSVVLLKAVNKNLGTLHTAISRDSNVFSGNSSSIVNGDLHQQNSHESILNNQQRRSAFQSQELPPLGPKDRLNEQLASSDNKFQVSAQLGIGVCDPKRMISPVNGTVDNSWRKPQYANVVSQQSSGPGRRFTVLTRELTSTDTVSKATGQVCSGISNSKKPTLPKDEHVSMVPRCQNVKVVPQRPYVPPHKSKQLSLATVKSHAGEEEKNACSDISDNPVQAKHMQFSMSTASASTASQSLSGSTTIVSNPLTSGVVSQMLVEIDKLSDSHRKLASENKSPVLNQQKAAVSNKVVASVSDSQSILANQVVSTDGKHLASARGDQSLYNREVALSGDIISSQHVESSWIPRPVSVLSSTGIMAKDNNGRKRQVCPPGFKELHHSSDSDQPDIINWVSECLENDEDTKQSNSASISSTLGSTDTIWRSTQLHGSCFGASNHCLLPPYPGGLLQCMGGVQNPMKCCCTFPSVSSTPNQKPEYWNRSANNCMAPGGYDAFFQNTTSGMKTGMVGSLLQQSSPPSLYAESAYGSADASLNSAHVDHSYPMYTLF